MSRSSIVCIVLKCCAIIHAPTALAQGPITFVDVAADRGLAKPLAGMMAHAMACGDIDNDGDLDIYLGTYCDRPVKDYLGRSGPVANMLLKNESDKFVLAGKDLAPFGKRTSGAVFVDFDNDGDLDLYVSNNSNRTEKYSGINRLYENVDGHLRDVSKGNSACIVMGGRGLGVLDYNGDGLLDLLVLEDYWRGGNTRLFRNLGGLKFQDVTSAAGLRMVTDEKYKVNLRGLGVVSPDFNNDGWPDLFISEPNLMFLNDGRGRFLPVDSKVFASPLEPRHGQYVAGAACRDLDNDGDLDIVTVDHADRSGMYVYMNQGLKGGRPKFVDVTKTVGLDYKLNPKTAEGLYLRHDHVEICDFDNDGRRDIFVGNTYPSSQGRKPFICRNLGGRDTSVRFTRPPHEMSDAHYPAGAIADYDRDGRMDIFLASWFPAKPTMLLLNRTATKHHWLQVAVEGKSINRMGIGAKVFVYRAGKLGDRSALLGYDEIGITQGFCTGSEAICHFGLGAAASCDVEVVLPFGKGRIAKKGVEASQRITVKEE